YERNMTQKNVAEMLNISPSRLSELMHGKTNPTFDLARTICQKLNIEPSVVLGL
ncbi:MAG: helix-turn-helix transcriptional regulator, partial [Bacteroidales bacterium]|nr:helix-turn-helix transcriptional regulator [Bacteroidales bacterium]